MPPDDPTPVAESFRELDTQLASLRGAAKALRQERPSWFENFFHPGRYARRQADFGIAVGTALKEIARWMSNATAQQGEREQQLAEVRREVEQLRATNEQIAGEFAETIQAVRLLRPNMCVQQNLLLL